MTDMIRMTVVLTLIACAAALLIAFTNSKTRQRIAEQKAAAQEMALKQILPEGAVATPKKTVLPDSNDSLLYWDVTINDTIYYAFKVGARGYSSIIKSLVCVDTAGIIMGMAILEQSETPGLGSRIQEVLSKKYFWNGLFGAKESAAPWFTEQFKGVVLGKPIDLEKSIGEWHGLAQQQRDELKAKNGITAITGSTISTRAVIKSINDQAMTYLQSIRG